MARGGFYRRRGASPNLSALIASLIREFRAAQDKAIFDAYNNGGKFEGKPVDDKRLLQYIQQRRDGFASDDPLYDQWNNTLIQQKFSIGEQKIGLLYKQGKVGPSRVAAFYKDQLKSIPKNSAFYREVAGRAAEWSKAARQGSGGGGGGGGGANATHNAQTAANNLQNDLAQFAYADYAVRAALAREGYVVNDNDSVWSVGADVIKNLFAQGKVALGSGLLSLDNYQQIAQGVDKGYHDKIAAYRRAGYDYVSFIDERHQFQKNTLTQIDTIPYKVRAESIYATLNDDLEAAQGNPNLIAKAYARAQGQITALAKEADKAGADGETVASLQNDALSLAGQDPKGPGMLDSIIASNQASGQSTFPFLQAEENGISSNQQVAKDAKATQDGQKLLASGQGYLVQKDDGSVAVVDQKIQPESTLGQEYQATVVISGGTPVKLYLKGTAVYANAQIDNNGNFVPLPDPRSAPTGATSPNALIGYEFTYKLDGKEVTAWAVRDSATGTLLFTKTNPFLGNETKTANGIVVAQPELDGETLDINTYTSTDALQQSTSNLVIDTQAESFINSNPERAYQLYKQGQIDAETLVQTLQPNAPAGSTPESALAFVQKNRDDAAAAIRDQRMSERTDFSPQAQQAQAAQGAQSILANILAQSASTPSSNQYIPPSVNVGPPINWTAAQTQAALNAQRLGEKAPLNTPPSVNFARPAPPAAGPGVPHAPAAPPPPPAPRPTTARRPTPKPPRASSPVPGSSNPYYHEEGQGGLGGA